jgi:type IV pilus assembly protein PilB
MSDRPRVGEILVAAGIIDDMQLTSALGEQSRWGRRLGVTLIKLGMVEEGHLIRALAKQLDLPVASLAGKKIPDRVIALVPASVASEHCVIPLFTRGDAPNGQLYLGMEDPSNLAVLDDLSFRTGMEIYPVMVGPSEIGEAIDRYYHGHRGANGGAPRSDPFRGEATMSAVSLRIVTDDTAQPGTAPAPIATEPSTVQAVEPPASRDNEIELSERDAQLPEGLVDNLTRALEETERTRIVAKAMAHLLIEKGLLSLEEIQQSIAQIRAAAPGDSPKAD